jgi:hypothetical protein
MKKTKKIYFTVTGTGFRYGSDFFKPDMTVKLVKEPDNRYDREAIKVELEGLGHVGYVANSVHTVKGESFSAGRLYDKIGDTAEGTVMYVIPDGVICALEAAAIKEK